MKRKLAQFVICMLLMMLVPFACIAENTADHSKVDTAHRFAIILPAVDGYKSVLENSNVSVQEILDIYIAAAEGKGDLIRLQGSTTNNNPSNLRYRTEDDESVKWENIPTRGNKETLASTLLGLKNLKNQGYNDFDQIIVISGYISTPINRVNISNTYDAPTYLIQTEPFGDGSTLLSQYSSLFKNLKIPSKHKTDSWGADVYYNTSDDSSTLSELHYLTCEGEKTKTLLDYLLMETLFDGSMSINAETFSIPSTLVDEYFIMITGDSLDNIRLVSPDGTKYTITTDEETNSSKLNSRRLSLSGKEVRLVSMKPVLSSGQWKIENAPENTSATIYFSLKNDAADLIQSARIVDESIGKAPMRKGNIPFDTVTDTITKDLFGLYPGLRLRITDTVNQVPIADITANMEQPDHVDIPLTTGGEHTLTFRLEDGEKEETILQQALQVSVLDNAPVFTRDEGEEVVVYPDTLEENEWSMSVDGWFSDPDGDHITVSKVGGDTHRVSFANNTITLHLEKNVLDGSEEVILNASSDTASVTASVKLVWRSLLSQINDVKLITSVEPVNAGETLQKRTKVRVKGQISYDGPDMSEIRDELKSCVAEVKDEDGNAIANAEFDDEKREFLSEPFELPDTEGKYTWKLFLHPDEKRIPHWSIEKKTERVTIENHTPVINPDIMPENLFGEQFAFDYHNWSFRIPEELIVDPDKDPITYQISIRGDHPAEPITFIGYDEIKPITLPEFGEYTITVSGNDNEGIQTEEITRKVQLKDLKKTLEGVKGTLSVLQEKEKYKKRGQVKLILTMDSGKWSERETAVLSEWFENCLKEVVRDDDTLTDIEVQYYAEEQTFTADIRVPEQGRIYNYQILLTSKAGDDQEIVIKAAVPYKLDVENEPPAFTDESVLGNTGPWMMKAEEYEEFVIPENVFTDPDGDQLKYSLKLIRKDNAKQTEEQGTDLPEETNQETDITLPYTVRFEPFNLFELSRAYEVTITASDGDAEPKSYRTTVTIHNKQLLYIIIGAVILLLLIITAIIMYGIHRKNLPAFDGKLYFTQDGRNVSQEIDLRPWKKQKHLMLPVFAGSITVLLDNIQWESMKKLEVRPDKNEGFKLYQVKAKSKVPEELPYELGNGLFIEKK